MGRVVLKQLTMEGFRSFYERTTIDLPHNGLVLIRGRSGHGKSTINLAISFALGFCPFPGTSLRSWGSENGEVVLTLEVDEREVMITRPLSGKASVVVNGKVIKGSASAVDDAIALALGLSPAMLSALTYRPQRERGLFLSKTDSEKKEFLTELLGLDRFEEAMEIAQEKIRNLTSLYDAKKATLEEASQRVSDSKPKECSWRRLELEAFQRKLDAKENELANILIERDKEIAKLNWAAEKAGKKNDESIAELKAKMSRIAGSVNDIVIDRSSLESLEQTLKECSQRIVNLQNSYQQRLTEVQGKRKSISDQIEWHNKEISQKKAVTKETAEIENQLAIIRNSICPTCTRPWDCAHDTEVSLNAKLKGLNEQLHTIEQSEKLKTALTEGLSAIEDPKTDPTLEKLMDFKLKVIENIAKEKQKHLNFKAVAAAEISQEVAEIQTKITELQAEAKAAYGEVLNDPNAMHRILQKRYEDLSGGVIAERRELNAISSAVADYEAQVRNHEQAVSFHAFALGDFTEVEKNLKAEQDFLQLIGKEGFLGSIFDEVLNEISTETNQILGSVANTNNVTLQFKSEVLTQKGTTKKSIVPVIRVGGNEAPFGAGLSGGMQTSVELAVDLAVGRVISTRTGCWPGWLLLDEAFDGLGPFEKESCMEILVRYASDRTVLVVDHTSETKEMFSKIIDVTCDNGHSTIIGDNSETNAA